MENIFYADSNFFLNFSFRLKRADPRTALQSIRNVALSETTARKYFGDRDPMGKTVQLIGDSTQLFTVAGIAEDTPSNSSIRYDWVVPLLSDPDYADNLKERFNHWTHLMVVELSPGTDPAQFERKMNK